MDMATQLAAQGQQAMQAGMYEQAVQAYYQAIQYAPHMDGLYYQYATACLWRGLPNDALSALDRCMGLRGPWYNHAAQLAMQVRSQLGFQQQAMPMMGAPGMMPGQMAPMGQMGAMPMPGQAMAPMPAMAMAMPGQAMSPMMGQAMGAPQQAAPAPAPAKKKGVGWGLAALGIVGAAALGGAIGTGALDGVADKVFG